MVSAYVCTLVLGVVFGIAGCGSDDDKGGGGGAKGGSCVSATQCYQVTNPADYSIEQECTVFGGTYSKDPCNTANYKRKCTEVLQVSVNDGPEQDVTYVYFYPEGSTEECFGTEEQL